MKTALIVTLVIILFAITGSMEQNDQMTIKASALCQEKYDASTPQVFQDCIDAQIKQMKGR